jgi:hypothetical protein
VVSLMAQTFIQPTKVSGSLKPTFARPVSASLPKLTPPRRLHPHRLAAAADHSKALKPTRISPPSSHPWLVPLPNPTPARSPSPRHPPWTPRRCRSRRSDRRRPSRARASAPRRPSRAGSSRWDCARTCTAGSGIRDTACPPRSSGRPCRSSSGATTSPPWRVLGPGRPQRS